MYTQNKLYIFCFSLFLYKYKKRYTEKIIFRILQTVWIIRNFPQDIHFIHSLFFSSYWQRIFFYVFLVGSYLYLYHNVGDTLKYRIFRKHFTKHFWNIKKCVTNSFFIYLDFGLQYFWSAKQKKISKHHVF